MAIAFDSSGSTQFPTAVASATFDVTSAAVGSTVFAFWAVGKDMTGVTAPTGWTMVFWGVEGTQSTYALMYKVKASGDSTFTISWTGGNAKGEIGWVSYLGLASTPLETASVANNVALHTTSSTTYPSPSVTPVDGTRWALYGAQTRSATTANGNISWTPDAALTERVDVNSGATSSVFSGLELADSNGAVTAAAHSYAATEAFTENHGSAFLIYLVPSSGAITAAPPMISSAEAFGTPSMVAGVYTANPTGVASSEAFGTPTSTPQGTTFSPSGVTSAEAFGALTATTPLTATAVFIDTGEAFGVPSVSGPVTASPTGVAGAEAFGTPSSVAGGTFAPVGIASAQAMGTNPTVTQWLISLPTGVASGEAFGTATVSLTGITAVPPMISSAEAFGAPAVTTTVTCTANGVASAETFGLVTSIKQHKAFIAPTYEQPFGPSSSSMARQNGDRLFSRLTYPVGYAVLKTNGFYRLERNPDAETIASADVAYLGGHIYYVSDQEAADLTAAGYTVSFQ